MALASRAPPTGPAGSRPSRSHSPAATAIRRCTSRAVTSLVEPVPQLEGHERNSASWATSSWASSVTVSRRAPASGSTTARTSGSGKDSNSARVARRRDHAVTLPRSGEPAQQNPAATPVRCPGRRTPARPSRAIAAPTPPDRTYAASGQPGPITLGPQVGQRRGSSGRPPGSARVSATRASTSPVSRVNPARGRALDRPAQLRAPDLGPTNTARPASASANAAWVADAAAWWLARPGPP